jgi:thiamine monophosphate synthase
VLATPVPILAVGGVTVDTAAAVARAGAAGIAAIGVFTGPTPDDVATSVDRIARAFDLARSGS